MFKRLFEPESLRTLGLACVSVTALLGSEAMAQVQSEDVQAARPDTAPTTTSPLDGSSDGIQDIVVTAQRRSESVQKSSLAISVLDSTQLAQAGAIRPTELGQLVAGVQVGSGGGTPQIYIRGVGDFGVTAQANPAVAFNTDGVYVARQQAIATMFYDVARLEVLKGPQGTLYGRNATGGAINLITNRPKLDRTEASIGLEVGNYDAINADAAINLPLGSAVALRLSGQIVHRDGYLKEGLDDDKHESARAQILFEPDDRLSILLAADYAHVGGKGSANVPFPKTPGSSPWNSTTGPGYNAALAAAFPGLGYQLSAANNRMDSEFWSAHAEVNYDLDFATLTFIPAYRDARMSYASNTFVLYDNAAGAGPIPSRPETSKATSAELRLGNANSSLKWTIGGFFFDERQRSQYRISGGLLQNTLGLSNFRSRSYAGFGEATLSVTDRLRAIAGGRYTYDRRELRDGAVYNVFPVIGCLDPAQPLCLTELVSGKRTFKKFSWKLGGEFDLTPQNMIFATASTGFKGGGLNQNVGLAPGSTEAETYEPERLLAYTVGSRNRFFDNNLQLNVELFYWKYTDQQQAGVTIDGQGNVAFRLFNAGKARQYGASVDMALRVGPNGKLRASVEYLNSKFTDFVYQLPTAFVSPATTGCSTSLVGSSGGALTSVDCSGFQLTRAPTWSGNAGYAHTLPLSNGGAVIIEGDMNFGSKRWLAPDFIPNERAPSYVQFGSRVTYSPPGAGLSISAYIKNLTNKAVYTGGLQNAFLPGSVTAIISAPRTYGLQLRANF